MTFEKIISTLNEYWHKQGCHLEQGYDLELGAGTFNPATFLKVLGSKPQAVYYVEPTRRPTDGRYGENPNRLQRYFQYQVIIKPPPTDIKELYLQSLFKLGIDASVHDIRFVHDDWESPSLGAWGLGWEVWINGMEVTQFTYFQQAGGISLNPITVELTYGLERLAMYLQQVDSVYDLQYSDIITYGELFKNNEHEFSTYNFEVADIERHFNFFIGHQKEAELCIEKKLPLVAYDCLIKCSHVFNLLDARSAFSVTERQSYIGCLRKLSSTIATLYLERNP